MFINLGVKEKVNIDIYTIVNILEFKAIPTILQLKDG